MAAWAACGMEPPAAGNVNTSAGAGSSMYVRPPPLHAVMQSWRGGRFFHGRSACNPAARMLRKDGLHALLQRFRHVLQDLLQPLRFGLQCCAYKFNPPVDVRSGHDFPVPQVDVAPPYDIVYSSYCRLLVSGRHVRAFSSGGERFPDTEEVRSSNLLTPTMNSQARGYVLWHVFV